MNNTETFNRKTLSGDAPELTPLIEAEITAGAGSLEQKTWSLGRAVTLIGRSRHAHIRVDGDDIESIHAALLNTGDAIVLADPASRYGIYCGNQKVKVRVLQPGEMFRVGSCLLQLDGPGGGPTARLDPAEVVRLTEPVRLADEQGQSWTARQVGVVIGSRPGCTVRLQHPDVLPLHAILTRVGCRTMVVSLVADRLVRINGEPAGIAPLATGDKLSIRPFTLAVTVGGEALRPEPAGSGEQDHRHEWQEATDRQTKTAPAATPPAARALPPANAAGEAPAQANAAPAPSAPPCTDPPAATQAAHPAGLPDVPADPAARGCDTDARLAQVQEQVLNSSKHLRQWHQQLEQYANGLIRRDAELTRRGERLDDLQKSLRQSEARIEQRSSELDQAQAALARQEEQYRARAGTLRQEREDLERENGRLLQQIDDLTVEQQRLYRRIEHLEARAPADPDPAGRDSRRRRWWPLG